MIKIKAIDLMSVATFAKMWCQKQDNEKLFKEELEAAKTLEEALLKVEWDEDAELIIDEAPF